ncbi:hypothetical protein DPSP01_007393 [Paraphaeosphaeria sporulosa]
MAIQAPSSNFQDLLTATQTRFKATAGNLHPESWWILALSAVCASGKPSLAADVYSYLISLPHHKTPNQRQKLMRKVREALVKNVPIIGVARPLEAIMCIDAVTRPEDKDSSFSREHWTNDKANHERGTRWLRQLYSDNLDPIKDMFKTQRDFGWISEEITYGLYLSDHRILDGVETELVVLSGMIAQNLPRMTAWHLRACRRMGLTPEECEVIQSCAERIVEFAGVTLEPLPRVKNIEHEV